MVSEEVKIQIDILLNEYQACHRNRNHYDSVRWSIGSIFIAASFTVYGFSLGQQDKSVALALVLLSMFPFFIWYFYYQHVNSTVMASIVRMQKIETELRNMDYHINLHNSIRSIQRRPRGIWITYSLLWFMSIAWIYKISLLLNLYTLFNFLTCIGVSGLLIYVFHIKIINKTDWVERIQSV